MKRARLGENEMHRLEDIGRERLWSKDDSRRRI